ncbi:type VII secretion integral membrane protein EccD [Mycobacterium sp. CVI_P3]|uniref:Type VII secretion integral membrane protein EccD n=1 Tax=Mycobacterium pinniadriaticum TaxID=2994102 RepID=A0ABT3SDW2_9MYCO|nr:type VII secretion integral membrane protein EccD [Mycobacterium pinniadriaticum]MCX2931082.1 type VII secretion integral membrane protein EccD [Mycobacterium pinniadriaticum]MCX2937694.1 type VII secretion integral membrane protein EccD [Mycobacterium pinniadriaticum]
MPTADETCRVSVRTVDRETDVALPARAPIAELIPAMVDLIGTDHFAGHEPHLTRVTGEVLDPASTLAHCSIQDGELLILTTSVPPPPVTRFDPSTAVVSAVTALTTPARSAAGLRTGWITVSWASVVLLALLGHTVVVPDAAGHAAVGAAAAVLAMAGAVVLHRTRRDRRGAVVLGVLASAFASVTAALASSDRAGLPDFLLAMSAASAVSLVVWRLLGCAASVFLPIAAVTMAASTAAVGAVAAWWPTAATGPILATASVGTLAVSGWLSVRSSGLPRADLSDAEVDAKTEVAHRRLTTLVVSAAGAGALGAVITAATTRRPVLAAGFIAIVGATMLLRSHRHEDRYRTAALKVSSGISITSLIALCAMKAPPSSVWLCGGLLFAGACALWLPRHEQWLRSIAWRRVIAVLDLAVGAAVVPSAAAAAGAFAALPWLGQV